MNTGRERLLSIGATGTGFLLAALAGLFLTAQVRDGNTAIVVPGALIAFVLVLPFFAFGIVMYIRSVQKEDAIEVSTDMSGQRQLFDVIRQHGCITVDDLASALQMNRTQVLSELSEMVDLQIFNAYYDPSKEIICAEDRVTLLALTKCRVCDAPVQPLADETVMCSNCGTQYIVT